MRRRGFAFGRASTNPNTPAPLRHAHELMERGDYARAALAFEQLASVAEERGGPRAPFLFIQAGHPPIQLNQSNLGLAHFRHGLELLAFSERYLQLYRTGNRVVQELKASGLEKEAQEITGLINKHIPAISESPTQRDSDPLAPDAAHTLPLLRRTSTRRRSSLARPAQRRMPLLRQPGAG